MIQKKSVHIPVLLQEVINQLNLIPGDVVLDGTLGGGSYSRSIAKIVGQCGKVIAFDQDQNAIGRFQDKDEYPQISIHHSNFSQLEGKVEHYSLNAAVLDLGISSDQLSDHSRGISFMNENDPLDMRMDISEDKHLTAWGILNSWSEEEIADMIYIYGEDRDSRRIAHNIVQARETGQMETVGDLSRAVRKASRQKGRNNPATKTFQALRIVVNDELGHLEKFLEIIPLFVTAGARLVIVSFHSLEDRIVKNKFREWKKQGLGNVVTKKPLVPGEAELKDNPRSRSSKLRTFIFN